MVIDIYPAGFDRAPTDPSNSSSELFVALTIHDVGKSAAGEAPIPEQIKDQVAKIKAEMEKEKENAANICGVPVAKTNVVFKAGSIDNQVPWTVVYEAIIPASQDIPAGVYTCWTREENGSLDTYPTVWDDNGKLQITEGNCFERLEGEVKWAGTTPVIYDPVKKKFAIPGGTIYDALLNDSSWMTLESSSTSEAVNLIVNPISPENMNSLIAGGYYWDTLSGSLKNVDGNTALTLRDGKWVDGSGAESSLESFKLVETNGIDYQGRDMLILTREIDGVKKIYLPTINTWEVPIDVMAGQRLIDINANTNPTDKKWGTFETTTFDAIPIINQEDIESSLLFYSRQLILREWPADVRVPTYQYVTGGGGYRPWMISEYPDFDGYFNTFTGGDIIPGGKPVVWEIDAIINLDVVKYLDRATQKWVINSGTQYYYQGRSLIINTDFKDDRADPTKSEFISTQMAVGNPSWVVNSPMLVNWLGINPKIAELLPPEVRARIAELADNPEVGSEEVGTYLIGDEMIKFQEYTLLPRLSPKRIMQGYLMLESDPFFDTKYPDKP